MGGASGGMGHDLWHLVVLGSTLFGGAGVALALLAPLLFDRLPAGFAVVRRVLFGLGAAAALLLAAEWRWVH